MIGYGSSLRRDTVIVSDFPNWSPVAAGDVNSLKQIDMPSPDLVHLAAVISLFELSFTTAAVLPSDSTLNPMKAAPSLIGVTETLLLFILLVFDPEISVDLAGCAAHDIVSPDNKMIIPSIDVIPRKLIMCCLLRRNMFDFVKDTRANGFRKACYSFFYCFVRLSYTSQPDIIRTTMQSGSSDGQ